MDVSGIVDYTNFELKYDNSKFQTACRLRNVVMGVLLVTVMSLILSTVFIPVGLYIGMLTGCTSQILLYVNVYITLFVIICITLFAVVGVAVIVIHNKWGRHYNLINWLLDNEGNNVKLVGVEGKYMLTVLGYDGIPACARYVNELDKSRVYTVNGHVGGKITLDLTTKTVDVYLRGA